MKVKRQQAESRAVKRGTVQHEVLEGEQASAFVEDDNLVIQVNCTSDAGILADSVPYALVTTLEVAEDIDIPIYDEVRARIPAAQVRVTPVE